MPIVETDSWRDQYFEGPDCPDAADVPTDAAADGCSGPCFGDCNGDESPSTS